MKALYETSKRANGSNYYGLGGKHGKPNKPHIVKAIKNLENQMAHGTGDTEGAYQTMLQLIEEVEPLAKQASVHFQKEEEDAKDLETLTICEQLIKEMQERQTKLKEEYQRSQSVNQEAQRRAENERIIKASLEAEAKRKEAEIEAYRRKQLEQEYDF